MKLKSLLSNLRQILLVFILLITYAPNITSADTGKHILINNFGLPGVIDLPTGRHLSDGEIVITQQLHKSLARSGISFQALPRVGLSFRYSGHGYDGAEAHGRINHDRSFDAHILIFDEGKYLPAVSMGLRDFIGTGWYSSEYLVSTKSFGNLDATIGLGFGRLAGRHSYSNPLGSISSRLNQRDRKSFGEGGTLGTINWFHGDASTFYGFSYSVGDKITLSSEYTSDLMSIESDKYLAVKSPWNFSASYKINNYLNVSAQYLHGSQVSLTANIAVNPARPPLLGGKELAPVPMRLRSNGRTLEQSNNENIIRKVLAADRFEINHYGIRGRYCNDHSYK